MIEGNYKTNTTIRKYTIDGKEYEWSVRNEDNAHFMDIVRGWAEFFRDGYLKHTPKRNTVIQAGGYVGVFPRLFSELFDVVYTFEPDPLSFFHLINNCQTDKIHKFNAALGDCHKMVNIAYAGDANPGCNRIDTNVSGNIPMLMIDDFAFHEVSLIQLDLEGYEIHALNGGRKTIEKFKPTIVLEDGNNDHLDFLAPFGYKEIERIHRDAVYAVLC